MGWEQDRKSIPVQAYFGPEEDRWNFGSHQLGLGPTSFRLTPLLLTWADRSVAWQRYALYSVLSIVRYSNTITIPLKRWNWSWQCCSEQNVQNTQQKQLAVLEKSLQSKRLILRNNIHVEYYYLVHINIAECRLLDSIAIEKISTFLCYDSRTTTSYYVSIQRVQHSKTHENVNSVNPT